MVHKAIAHMNDWCGIYSLLSWCIMNTKSITHAMAILNALSLCTNDVHIAGPLIKLDVS